MLELWQRVTAKATSIYGEKHRNGFITEIEDGVVWVIFNNCCPPDSHKLGFYEHELEER